MTAAKQVLIEKIKQLAPQRVAEVEDSSISCAPAMTSGGSRTPPRRPASRASRRCGTTTRTRLTTGC